MAHSYVKNVKCSEKLLLGFIHTESFTHNINLSLQKAVQSTADSGLQTIDVPKTKIHHFCCSGNVVRM